MSVAVSFTSQGLDRALRKLLLMSSFDMAELADEAGALLESSSRRRFETKLAPDGSNWPAWSEDYDETRNHDKHSLLVSEGDLWDSIQSYSTGSKISVGSNLVYAAHHQVGGDEIDSGIPARPYLGVSEQDEAALIDLVSTRVRGLFL